MDFDLSCSLVATVVEVCCYIDAECPPLPPKLRRSRRRRSSTYLIGLGIPMDLLVLSSSLLDCSGIEPESKPHQTNKLTAFTVDIIEYPVCLPACKPTMPDLDIVHNLIHVSDATHSESGLELELLILEGVHGVAT